MKLFLVEYQEENTGKMKEPMLVGESGLYELASDIYDDVPLDLALDVLVENGYEVTEITNAQDVFDMFDKLKEEYMNF